MTNWSKVILELDSEQIVCTFVKLLVGIKTLKIIQKSLIWWRQNCL